MALNARQLTSKIGKSKNFKVSQGREYIYLGLFIVMFYFPTIRKPLIWDFFPGALSKSKMI